MNSKNGWNIAVWQNELYRATTCIDHISRFADARELAIYKTGMLSYYQVKGYFAIHHRDGDCISGDLKYPDGKRSSTLYVHNLIQDFMGGDFNPFTEDETKQFLYLKQLYDRSENRMLTNEEYKQFKQIYHALQRRDYDFVAYNLAGKKGYTKFEPSRVIYPKLEKTLNTLNKN